MAYIVPDSVITLYNNVPITNQVQIAFKTLAQQTAYFATKILRSKVNCSYVRRNGRLKIEDGMGLMRNCNYISFRNPSFENKTIYARIIDYVYINNTTVEIQYVIDWFQTFMFDVTYEDAVMDREHLSIADWNKVEANPYDRSVYEMFTPENLPSDKSMEKIYDQGGIITYSGSAGYADMSNDVAYTYVGRPVIVMLISDYDVDEVGVDIFADFDIYIKSDGTVVTNASQTDVGFTSVLPQKIDFPVPKACTIGLIGCDSSQSDLRPKLDVFKTIVDNLTYQRLSQQVIGVYLVNSVFLDSYLDTIDGGRNTHYYGISKPNTAVTNKKLLTSPYEYIRVQTMAGDTKEYQYENFKEIQSGGNIAKLYMLSLIDGLPEFSIVPYKYKSSFLSDSSYFTINMNTEERIDFSAFPQISYTTDAYLTYLGEQYSNSLGQRTIGSSIRESEAAKWKEYQSIGSTAGSMINTAVFAGSGGTLGSPDIGGIIGGSVQSVWSAEDRYRTDRRIEEENNYRNTDASVIASGDPSMYTYADAKGAYVADNYVSGSNGGTLNYYIGIRDVGTFKITRVQLRDVFVQKYDAYFTHYGYSSSRIGVPRICNFMANSSNNAELPKFLTQTNGYSMTYVKTQSMNVNATMKPVSDFIEQMFNNGMRFIDGSTL